MPQLIPVLIFIFIFIVMPFKGVDYLFNITSNWDKITIILCFNMFSTFNLLTLGISLLLGKYRNFLIEKFKLEQRYHRLEKYIQYRLKIQKYYFMYLNISAILIVIMIFITNLIFLLIHYNFI